MLLESASLPVPSEVVLPFAGYLVFTGNSSSPWSCWLARPQGWPALWWTTTSPSSWAGPSLRRPLRWSGIRPEHLNHAGGMAQQAGFVDHPRSQIHTRDEVRDIAPGWGSQDELVCLSE